MRLRGSRVLASSPAMGDQNIQDLGSRCHAPIQDVGRYTNYNKKIAFHRIYPIALIRWDALHVPSGPLSRRRFSGGTATEPLLARACDLAPSTIGDLINGEIAVSEKNLARILHGFPDVRDQVDLLLAYLRGQVPSSLRGAVTIEAADTQWLLGEAPAASDPLVALPPKLRDEVASIARRMAEDAQLRDLFGRTVRYLDGEEERVVRRANAGLGLRPPASPVLAPETLPAHCSRDRESGQEGCEPRVRRR